MLTIVLALSLLSCESRASRKVNKALDEYEEGIKSGDKTKQLKALKEAREYVGDLKGNELRHVCNRAKELGEKYDEVEKFE